MPRLRKVQKCKSARFLHSLFSKECFANLIEHIKFPSYFLLPGSTAHVGVHFYPDSQNPKLPSYLLLSGNQCYPCRSQFPPGSVHESRASQTDKQNQIDYTFSVRLKTESKSLYTSDWHTLYSFGSLAHLAHSGSLNRTEPE